MGIITETWSIYRAGWRRKPYLIPMFVVGAILFGLGIVGTIARDPALILFVPGLLILFLHHFLTARAAGE